MPEGGLGFSISSPLTRHDALLLVHTIELGNNDDDAYVNDRVRFIVRQFNMSDIINLTMRDRIKKKKFTYHDHLKFIV